ncbi:MAG: hypothetical protein M1816_005278 [Peltula sp. TS41687]|nr:MAG: hypothetical protein M1816_005278 [Peltula sp. TS41687]
MRPMQSPPTLLSLLAILLSCHHTVAKPYPRDGGMFALSDHISFLREKRCANPCGWTGQVCCTADQYCYTDSAGQAQCGAGAGGGGAAGPPALAAGFQAGSGQQEQWQSQQGGQWQMFTTTWTETDLVTRVSTYSSYISAQVTAVAFVPTTSTWVPPATTQMQCNLPCGSICCAAGQYCAMAGQCAAEVAGGFSSSYLNSVSSYSAPLRPTSGTATTTTSTTAAVTTTVPFQTPVGTANNIIYGTAATTNRGLSAGAIAGIVIGIILLLLLIALALCFRGAVGLFGGRRKETRVEETYIRRQRHHHGASGDAGGAYHAGRPSRPSPPPPKKGGGLGGFGTVVAGLGTLALALGLKRKYDRRKEGENSSYGSASSYTYSEYDTTTSK